ncbi:MAG TPA: 4Fe-4S dicluster domain-containing protein [Acidobacteriota bacterium]|nr:4Fe-4S dicluster domain-containing protein [Acidobacteriota bacterium]
MGISRRDFLKTSAVAAAGGAATQARASTPEAGSTGTNSDDCFAVLVDTVVCVGCRKCEWACANEHKLSDKTLAEFEDRSVFAQQRRPDATAYTVVNAYPNPDEVDKPYLMKLQCMHCAAPACVSACIVGALAKSPRGPVVYDAWKCIGCRYCMVACPYQIPAYEYHNPLNPQVRKCTFCHERLQRGEKPACVGICPNEALTFGRRRDVMEVARARIRHNPDRYVDHVYGEHEIGGTSWMYLAGVDFSQTALPTLGQDPIPPLTENIQHGIFQSFIPPLALFALLGLTMHTLRERQGQGNADHDHA